MLHSLSRRNAVRLGGLLVGILLLFLLAWLVIAGPVTVLRITRYGDTNIDDYSHYPGRQLSPGDAPFSFDQTDGEMAISGEALGEYGVEPDLNALLEANDTITLLVVRDDPILCERYYQGRTPSSLSQLFSVTKSVTSALVGMAIADGYFEDVDQPITDFIPELAAKGFGDVTIHYLLTMMSGSDYQENDNPFGERVILNFTPQLEERILRTQMGAPPGTVFRYKSGDNALLGLALARTLEP
jgi:CubicO group peptidase (beta-lactamase class C family)